MATALHSELLSPQESFSDNPVTVDVAVQDDVDHTETEQHCELKTNETTVQHLMIYTRAQLLLLHKSPLVKLPFGMPAFRDWFGVENELSLSKKETDGSNTGPARDRRFRREADDSEFGSRPAFRSTPSQPSQMGNFKHQSIRGNDRDRDRDAERDRERDKEGQEKLRNLSDKYDRERLALPSISGFRNKEREVAPHLVGSSSSRTASQNQFVPIPSRRSDARDNIKKKAGESSEDWRRGEPHRSSRDERPENARKERDERERPRSRVEDPSRLKRDPSVTKRDRERRGDRDRDESKKDRPDGRREKDEPVRRDRDADKEADLDDPRRWKDDGKRDERMATRRERLEKDREHTHDKSPHEGHDLAHDRHHDRRWATGEEREGRSKRTSGRERRSGAVEEHREKDDRKDREREREKEPAWMDTYIPSEPSPGILGGKAANGELDGIQVWKKGMKAKEPGSASTKEISTVTSETDAPEKQLDEIQLFKLMMKREEEKKRTEGKDGENMPPRDKEGTSSGPATIREQKLSVITKDNDDEPVNPRVTPSSNGVLLVGEKSVPVSSNLAVLNILPTSQNRVSLVAAGAHSVQQSVASSPKEPAYTPLESMKVPSTLDSATDAAKPPISRLFPTPISSSESSFATTRAADQLPSETPSSIPFNPPPGSRLLAFGARTSSTQGSKSLSSLTLPAGPHIANGTSVVSTVHQNAHLPASMSDFSQNGGSSIQQAADITANHVGSSNDLTRAQQTFSPFEDLSRQSFVFEGTREPKAQQPEPIRRATELSMYPEVGPPNNTTASFPASLLHAATDPMNGSGTYASAKGSRFAKFFDGKTREAAVFTAKQQNPDGFQSSSPGLGQKHDTSSYNGVSGGNSEGRTMEDIFAMLNNSSQVQRGSMNNNPSNAPLATQVSYGQSHNLPSLQQQVHHQSQLHHHHHSNSRVEALYDSRIDDRSFIPDGLVPGLRSYAPGRNRENNLYTESPDDFNLTHRVQLQQRNAEQFYSSPLFQQTIVGRNASIPPPQPQYRSGPSPILSQNPVQNLPQRLPPGLANLGRSTIDTSQFLNIPGVPSMMMHANGSSQAFNSFVSQGSGASYGAGPQIRHGPPSARQLQQNNIAHNPMQGLGHPGNADIIRGNQAQLAGVGGPIGGVSSGFAPPQVPAGQMPLLAMRQQQSLPPHMMPHLLPQHLQQGHPSTANQPAHDLMTLLMGGSHRE